MALTRASFVSLTGTVFIPVFWSMDLSLTKQQNLSKCDYIFFVLSAGKKFTLLTESNIKIICM